MSNKMLRFSLMSSIIAVGLAPAVANADPVNVRTLDTTALRAMFQGEAFRYVCPLTVYSEDLRTPGDIAHARSSTESNELNPELGFARANTPNRWASPDRDLDGLDDYNEDFNRTDQS